VITIVIPTHDRPPLLRRTLQSLIAQTWQNFAVIVVSDSSTYVPPYQELSALAGRYTYVDRSGTPGPAESRNMGLALTQSRYVMFLDDDDTLEPGHLGAIAERIGDASPELLFCDFKVCNEDRTANPPKLESIQSVSIADVTAASLFVLNRIPNSCLIYRSDVVARTRYATDLIIYEDWDFLLGCVRDRTLTHVPVNSVTIHKSPAGAAENMRRGNSRNDLIVSTMLSLYKRHPAPSMEIRLARQSLLASAGVSLGLEHF